MSDDPKFDEWLSRAAPQVNAPPSTPSADMWDAIAGRLPDAGVKRDGQTQMLHITDTRRNRRARQWIWPTAIAAALLIGVGFDRFVLRNRMSAPDHMGATIGATPNVIPADSADPSRLYRLAAIQTLSQAEALLTAYRASNAAMHDPASTKQLGVWGRQVLSSTRLLIDSPAGDDPQLHALLDDLELVLVQIIRLSGAPLEESERALIDGAMKERDLLPRIRTAVPAGAASAATD